MFINIRDYNFINLTFKLKSKSKIIKSHLYDYEIWLLSEERSEKEKELEEPLLKIPKERFGIS